MLHLWDHAIERHATELGRLGRVELCELSVRTIEATTRLFEPPFVDYFPPEVRGLIDLSIEYCTSSRPSWQLQEGLAAQLYAQFDALPRIPIRPGVGPFMMAVQRLIEGASGPVDADVALEIMSACYEAILMSQLTGRVTVQMQEENGQCSAAIQIQEDLIAEYSTE